MCTSGSISVCRGCYALFHALSVYFSEFCYLYLSIRFVCLIALYSFANRPAPPQPHFKSFETANEKSLFDAAAVKLSRSGKPMNRVVVLTDKAVYRLDSGLKVNPKRYEIQIVDSDRWLSQKRLELKEAKQGKRAR